MAPSSTDPRLTAIPCADRILQSSSSKLASATLYNNAVTVYTIVDPSDWYSGPPVDLCPGGGGFGGPPVEVPPPLH